MRESNQANMLKWAQALESGQYLNAVGQLAYEFVTEKEEREWRFCCLGVACEIFAQENPGKLRIAHDGSGRHRSYDGESGSLPAKVQEWLGTPGSPDPMLISSTGETSSAIRLNDRYRDSFEQIAQAIRRTYLAPQQEGEDE